ncbi:glycosyltransferase family 87 protein [Streptomyces chiangmaiensis]|uniref:Glycosyltransferase family 87 protein n=1 Tax=Streptomyces chiangmaiensis TaxID=766497 RepID=A0ABU7F962_9ACTN|nr:glycosyltransferase family 87 protein [Streptomyces chiangmaiensis]MED7820414.1 glycosyltransferase family 87 protein [Streptomyces chiangmaiensis]
MAVTRRFTVLLLATWTLTRLFLLLFVFKVFVFPGPDVTSDVSVIYHGWYDTLRTGAFPRDDVTWQYPPAAALAILSPATLPFLDYAQAFYVLAFLADLAVLCLLVYAGRRPRKTMRGAWIWVIGVALLGPTVYARYDLMVTAVAVAALLAGSHRPRVMGALVGFGALLKVWPALLLAGAVRGRAWLSAGTTAGSLALLSLTMPGAFAFLTSQRDRGTEVESLGSLVFHVARHFGWQGQVLLNYGSVEFLGPYVDWVSSAALFLTVITFGWLLLWRVSVRRMPPHALADAAFVAVLLFTVTSRVISPQYMVWLVGLAAVCLCFRDSRMALPGGLVVVACLATVLEFPICFANVVASDRLGITLLFVRNGLLVVASLTAARLLWRGTVSRPAPTVPPRATRTQETLAPS